MSRQAIAVPRVNRSPRRGRRRVVAFLIAALLAVLAFADRPAPAVRAAGAVGTGTAASCTEAALDDALAAGGLVTFDCGADPVTITISSTKTITGNTTIDGGGKIAISGGGTVRVLAVDAGATLELRNVTIANGFAPGNISVDLPGGAGILNRGTTIITNSTIADNKGQCCTPSTGGGLSNEGGTVTIADSTFARNYVGGSGGAIENFNGTLTITNSTFDGNEANGGGGIFNHGRCCMGFGGEARVTVTNSTFTRNSGSAGGAIFNAQNAQLNPPVNRAVVTVTNSTFNENSASGLGVTPPTGGVFRNNGGTLTVRNSIAANSRAYAAPGECHGALDAASANNLATDDTCGAGFAVTTGAALKLGPLADNGGPTRTFALGAGSPAIDAGDPAVCAAASPNGPGGLDQRGLARVGACDIGAFELGIATGTTLSASPNPAIFGQAVTFTATVSAATGTASGQVTFKEGATTLGTSALDGAGRAAFTTAALGAGTHAITAVYRPAAGTRFEPGASAPLNQTVNKAGTTTALSSSLNPSNAGQAVTFTATVSSAAGTPGGQVTFKDGGATLGAGALDASGRATLTTAALTSGARSITAVYAGGSNFGGSASAVLTQTVIDPNRPPTANAGPDQAVEEGATVTLDGGGSTDPDGDPLTYSWSRVGGAGPAVTLSSTTAARPTFATTDDGAYLFRLTVSDGTGGTATDDVRIVVTNTSPRVATLTLSAPSIAENGTVALDGAFTDPGAGDAHSVTIDWGDGSSPTTLSLAAGARSFDGAAHQYLDDDPSGTPADAYTITVTVTDDEGGSGAKTTSLTVTNAPPVIGAVGGPAAPVVLGGPAGVSATFTDAGAGDTHTCTFAWDDGTTSSVTGSAGSCTGTRTYTAAGVYTVGVTVTDDDSGAATTKYEFVVVYDPNAGFVTGGGWIDSPAGAYAADPSLTGRAGFGFVSKYQKGAATPTGQTQFQFQAGDFTFRSDSYQWLVVAGAKAQYKGGGTVNGVGGYGFLLTATDGQVAGGGGADRFRIKIWRLADGSLVYDNTIGASDDLDAADPQAIGGGSIVIHNSK
ncbi:MAG: Ig-like domain repeat protein [Chloroflexota bacterium]|nr:Ig-like domain repeat protein [Chloroflexota bacterium]